jgi:hypothetical protein
MSFRSNEMFFKTYLDSLENQIRDEADKLSLPVSFAAARVIANILGYDNEDVNFVDGKGDRGIDFWYSSEGGLYAYQVKTHDFTEDGHIDYQSKFNSDGVKDLMRIRSFLLGNGAIDDNHKLVKFSDTFHRLVRNHKSQEIENPLQVYLSLIILGQDLTDNALDELADLESSLQEPINFEGMDIQFHVGFQNIEDIISVEWRQNNIEWRDRDGRKRDSIRLTPLRQADKRDYLNDSKSAIFYCSALDLVTAYEEFGYQIFAPNVRANIKNSNVNSAIQESASSFRSMKEFRFLNNGLTIICTSYKLPAGQRAAFEVTQPGIVNGLQTVAALHQAYKLLQKEAKKSFEEHCFVLVRLLRTDAVNQISEVVFATNNQNPMQPRNLVSNSIEQTHFFLYFANQLRWFYEAKQGAWEAFKRDEKGWRPRINHSANAFKALKGHKKIDNQDLAQNWLAFLGFADTAANDKKYLFDKDKSYYKMIFLSRPRRHGFDNYKSIEDALNDAENDTPDPQIMLAAHLARLFVNEVVPSTSANKKEALLRQGIKENTISPVEEASILSKDHEYTLNQALGTMSLVFVEFVGYTLFKIYGPNAHRYGSTLLKNYSWKVLACDLDFDSVVNKAIGIDKNLAQDDVLIIMWLFFREAVQNLMGGAWQTPYRNTRYKPRFVLNNRNQLYQEIHTIDEAVQRRVPIRIWAYGIQEGEGFFGYIERIITSMTK